MTYPKGWTLEYVASDEPDLTDDEYVLCVDGERTGWHIQVGCCDFAVAYWNEAEETLQHWGFYPTLEAAKAKLASVWYQ